MVGISPALASSDATDTNVRLGYFGETATHPGGLLGMARTVSRSLTYSGFQHSLVWGGDLAGYWHPRNHVGILLDTTLAWRLTYLHGPAISMGVGAGYLHTFLDGRTYVVEDGVVRRATDWGRPHLALLVPLELSWQLGDDASRYITPFLRLQGFVRYPYNGTFLPQTAAILGVAVPWSLFTTATETRRP